MKLRRRKVFKLGNLRKTTKGNREYFFRDGKRISADSFKRSAKRIRTVKKTERIKKQVRRGDLFARRSRRLKKRAIPPTKKSSRRKAKKKSSRFDLCNLKNRQAFYDKIIADRKELRDTISEEEMSALRVDIDIGNPSSRRTKSGKVSERGFRRFRDLRKLRNFLGLNYSYRNVPNFSPSRGICQYKKVANLVAVKLRGEREIGKKIYRKYIYEP